MRWWFAYAGLAALAGWAGAAGGCSSKSSAGAGGASGTASSASSSSSSSSTSGSGGAGGVDAGAGGADAGDAGGDAGTGGTSPNDLCVQTGYRGACAMCCDSDNPSGYATYISSLIQYCACTMGATCYAQCSGPMDLCANPSSMTGSSACIGCVNGVAKTDPCFTASSNSVDAACAADPSCSALLACSAGCSGLPN